MTDSEMTRRCAERIGYVLCKGSPQGRQETVMRYYRKPNGEEIPLDRFMPLERDRDCIKLVKALGISVAKTWNGGWCAWHETVPHLEDRNYNRAVVRCASQVQK